MSHALLTRLFSALAFELAPDGGARRYYFDGQALASYLHASKCFQNPLNREALSRADCERLDTYLRQHKLGRFTITRDFDDAAAAAAAAAVAGTAEALAAERAAAADALLRAFFAGSARRGDAGRRGGPQPTPAMQGDGNFVVIDDDAGMLRGRSRGAAEAALAQRPEAAAAARAAAEAFPSLPGVAPPRPAWPTLSASAAPAANAAPRSAAGPAAPAAERPLPSWWAMAAPAPARPAAAPAATSRAAADEAGDARRKQLAAAFGVSDPAARPSMFAAASAAAFSPDVLALARSDRAFVLNVEKRLDAALAARARRTSMPACGRPRRKLIHEVAERYGLVSSSYGEGPGRHVDVFCLPTSGHPTARLSDAALAPPEAVAAAAQPAGALPASKADLLAAQLRFSSVAEGADLERLLADSGAVLTWQSASEATAQFPSAAAMQEARDRLGGGLRGLFTVSAPPAELAPPPRRPAAQHDPWADEPPPQRAPPKRPAAPADWQSHVQTEAGVAAPMKGHIATRNAWAALGDEDEDAEDEDGDWDAEQGEDEAEDEADEPSSQHAASDGDNGDPDAAVPQPDAPQADSSE